EDNESPIITLEPDSNPVLRSVGDQFTLPTAIAIDNVDGELDNNNIEVDVTSIQSYYNAGLNKFIFTLEGTYVVTYSVFDDAGNEGTLTLTIIVETVPEQNFEGYYESLNGLSGGALVNALYTLLNQTGTYVTTTYGDARYMLGETDRWVGFNTDYIYLMYTDTLKGSVSLGYPDEGYATPAWEPDTKWNREHV